MTEAWIRLHCPDCNEHWEVNPRDMPSPGNTFSCDHCGTRRSVTEFPRTGRDLAILKYFHES